MAPLIQDFQPRENMPFGTPARSVILQFVIPQIVHHVLDRLHDVQLFVFILLFHGSFSFLSISLPPVA